VKRTVWLNLAVGFWLIVAPFVLQAAAPRAWNANDLVLGILLAACSWWMLASTAPITGAAWFEMLCGIWLIAAPFALQYHVSVALWNDVVCGAIAIVVSGIAIQMSTRLRMPA
jgi:hypothetical protein